MRRFRWLLNWSIQEILTNHGDIIPVFVSGRNVGNCTIEIDGNKIIGDFSLTEDLLNENYLLYLISDSNSVGQRWLTGITILPPDDNLRDRASTVGEMNEQRAAL